MLKKDAIKLINDAFENVGPINNGYGVDGRKKQLEIKLLPCTLNSSKNKFQTPKKVVLIEDVKVIK